MPFPNCYGINFIDLKGAEEREQPGINNTILRPPGCSPDAMIRVFPIQLYQRSERHITAPAILQEKFSLIRQSCASGIKAFSFLFLSLTSPILKPKGSHPFYRTAFRFVFIGRHRKSHPISKALARRPGPRFISPAWYHHFRQRLLQGALLRPYQICALHPASGGLNSQQLSALTFWTATGIPL